MAGSVSWHNAAMVDVNDPTRQSELDPKLREIVEETSSPRRPIYCAFCSAIITTEDNRIEMAGSHDHRFTNPAGYRYGIGCFDEALGCSISGSPTDENTWFAGYHWQVANCGECAEQLGWFFDSGSDHFFGLILDRLEVSE
ncbi:MAG: cereblon family protein [Gammaproteobacteria bacterium]